jgi:hypothetical protein
VRAIVELALGTTDGPTKRVHLIAALHDPRHLNPASTGYLTTALPRDDVSAEQVSELSRFRDWIAQSSKPAQHELGWADYSEMRSARAIVRHGQLVLLASPFRLVVGAVPALPSSQQQAPTDGGKSAPASDTGSAGRVVWTATLRGGAGVGVPVGRWGLGCRCIEDAGLRLVERRPVSRPPRGGRETGRRSLPAT